MSRSENPVSKARKSIGTPAAGNDFLPLAVPLAVYAIFSGWLFWPYLGQFSGYQYLYAINPVLAAWGVYFLSRRWINNWTPSVLAGAAYGLGPFALSFSIYHPLAGIVYVMIPWLFLPSVYWGRSKNPSGARFLTRGIFSLLPFAAVFGLFWVLSRPWIGPYFLMPQTTPMNINDFRALFFPLYETGGKVIFSIYHIPLLLSLMGIFVLAVVQRVIVLIPFAAGLVLCFLDSVMQVSPIVWAAFPILFLSMLSGLGFQSMLYAGKSDSKWIIGCAIIAAALAAFFAGLSLHPLTGRVFDMTAMFYLVAAIALAAVYYFIRAKWRLPWGKWAILTSAVLLDIILSSRYLVGKLL